VPDYFTTLHGVMKFEKEPSAFEEKSPIAGQENRRSPTFEFDRRQTVSPFLFTLVIIVPSS
jgi:hypothetical protein